jgi:uncharacterized membrane protein YedE/YeeE
MTLAGHRILSKYSSYAHSLKAFPLAQAETGGMLIYYGGDIINLVLNLHILLSMVQSYLTSSIVAYSSVNSPNKGDFLRKKRSFMSIILFTIILAACGQEKAAPAPKK